MVPPRFSIRADGSKSTGSSLVAVLCSLTNPDFKTQSSLLYSGTTRPHIDQVVTIKMINEEQTDFGCLLVQQPEKDTISPR